jgi:hypothetical protein
MFGYCPYYLETVRVNSRRVLIPKVPAFGTYTVLLKSKPLENIQFDYILNGSITTSMLHYQPQESKCKRRKLENGLYNVVFEETILPDVVTGKHNSITATLLRGAKYNETLRRFSLQAEYIKSFPKVFTRHNKDDATKTDAFDSSSIIDNSLLRIKQRQKDALALQAMNHMQECQERPRGYINIDDERISLANLEENIFQLPDGTELATTGAPVASSRQDLVDIEVLCTKTTLGSFGVPMSLFVGRDYAKKGNVNDNDLRLFFKTLSSYKAVIEEALQNVFDMIHPLNTPITNARDLRSGHPQRQHGDEQMTSSYQRIKIPLKPDIPIQTILELYGHDAIDKETMKRYLVLSAGLSLDEMKI